MTTQDLQSQAALYLLGQLTPDEIMAFELYPSHREALTEMSDVVALIGIAVEPVAPPPELKGQVLERLERNPYPGLFSKRVD